VSTTSASAPASAAGTTEHFDVLVVGAGISGLAGAYHLKDQCADKTFVILESQESFGGTWRSHKYPGIRSDSDLYTFGFRFKPWVGPPIATADEILKYLGEVIEENDLAGHIRYRQRILQASWSSENSFWTVVAEHPDTGDVRTYTTNFLWMGGYYRHFDGYTPDWQGKADFQGLMVHSGTWPEELDLSGKKVVVIGSGATAATVIPAMADHCRQVTMLQRSPGYYFAGHNRFELADTLRELDIDERWIHEIVRRKILHGKKKFQRMCEEQPERAKELLLADVRAYLGPEMTAKHFTPRYLPWIQRICFVPDGDLFQAIADGKVSVVTDEIERFTKDGVLLKSGETLEADVVVAATGLNLNMLGDINFMVDGKAIDFSKTVMYRGLMFTGVPNLIWAMGYFQHVSWTLRTEVVADFFCRLLNHMKEKDARSVAVTLRPEDADMELLSFIDPQVFNPGYVQRAIHLWPKRGDKPEWQHSQNYARDLDEMPLIDLDDTLFVYRGCRPKESGAI
jgi:cation diffusion facilitator CzcD-associated flavoprotein CzcO